MEDTISGLREAADMAGVTTEAMRKWCASYPGLAVQEGRWWRIDRTKLDTLIQARAVVKDRTL